VIENFRMKKVLKFLNGKTWQTRYNSDNLTAIVTLFFNM